MSCSLLVSPNLMMRSYYYNFLLCLCLFVSLKVCFHAVKANWKQYLTYLIFKWPYMRSTKINPRTYLQIYTAHAHPADPDFTQFCHTIIIIHILFLLSIVFTCFENLLNTSDISIQLESLKTHDFHWFPDDFKVDNMLKIHLDCVHAFSNSIF